MKDAFDVIVDANCCLAEARREIFAAERHEWHKTFKVVSDPNLNRTEETIGKATRSLEEAYDELNEYSDPTRIRPPCAVIADSFLEDAVKVAQKALDEVGKTSCRAINNTTKRVVKSYLRKALFAIDILRCRLNAAEAANRYT